MDSPSTVQRINESARPLTHKRLTRLSRLLAHIRPRPAPTASLQIRIPARLRARPRVHTRNLTRAVDLIRGAFELVSDELGAAGDGAGAAVELLAGSGGAEEAFFGAGVGEGRVPGVPRVVCGGEGALGSSRVGEDGGGGSKDGAEEECGVHCVGDVDGVEEGGELAFGVGEGGLDGVLEGVVGSVNRGGGRCWWVVRRLLLLLGLEVKVDRGRHLLRVPDAGQRLYVYDTACLSPCAFGRCVRACPFRLQSSEGNLRAYTSHSQPSGHPHHRTPARPHTHRSRAPTRRSGAREVWEAS